MRLPLDVVIERYKNSLFSAAFAVCKNPHDAEDIIQDTFLAYHASSTQFESERHIRAWLLRVAINKAKNVTTSFWRKNMVTLEEYMETLIFEESEDRGLFEAVMDLPEKYRIVIQLFYYEDYSIREIASLLHSREGTVKSHLSRGRMLLKTKLKEEWNDDES